MAQSLEPRKMWILLDAKGGVKTAHCDCPAGYILLRYFPLHFSYNQNDYCFCRLSLMCSHIGMLLYCAASLKSESCTSRTQEWGNYRTNRKELVYLITGYHELPLNGNKIIIILQDLPDSLSDIQVSKRGTLPQFWKARDITPVSEEKFSKFLEKLREEKEPCVLLRSEIQTCENFLPEQMKIEFPPPLTSIYDECFQLLSIRDLINLSEDYLAKYNLTADQRSALELLTRKQYKSVLWSKSKEGRISASVVHQVLRTPLDNPAKTVVQMICCTKETSFTSPSTQ